MSLADRLRANAMLLDMMVSGETRLSRTDLAALVADLRQYARELERGAGRQVEREYQIRRAAA